MHKTYTENTVVYIIAPISQHDDFHNVKIFTLEINISLVYLTLCHITHFTSIIYTKAMSASRTFSLCILYSIKHCIGFRLHLLHI